LRMGRELGMEILRMVQPTATDFDELSQPRRYNRDLLMRCRIRWNTYPTYNVVEPPQSLEVRLSLSEKVDVAEERDNNRAEEHGCDERQPPQTDTIESGQVRHGSLWLHEHEVVEPMEEEGEASVGTGSCDSIDAGSDDGDSVLSFLTLGSSEEENLIPKGALESAFSANDADGMYDLLDMLRQKKGMAGWILEPLLFRMAERAGMSTEEYERCISSWESFGVFQQKSCVVIRIVPGMLLHTGMEAASIR